MKISENRKAFIIGSGFDKMFGMPTWNELISFFKCYLLSNSNKDLIELEKKLCLIYKQKISIERKFGMLLEYAEWHGFKNKKIKHFLKKTFNINNYSKNKKLLKDIFKDLSASEDLFVTTNFSNTFDVMGWKAYYEHAKLWESTYVPIHGNIFQKKEIHSFFNVILFEIDYINGNYKNDRMHLVNGFFSGLGVEEIHIYGYSINDINIFQEIVNSNVNNIYLYLGYLDIEWRDLQITYFKGLFNKLRKKVYFITPEDNIDNLAKTNNEFIAKCKDPYVKLLRKMTNNSLKSKNLLNNDYLSAKNLKQKNPAKTSILVELFINKLRKNNNLKKLEIIVDDLISSLKKEYNTNLIIALEYIAWEYSEYIKKEEVKNIVFNHFETFFKYNNNYNLTKLVQTWEDFNIYKKYLQYSNDLSILSGPPYKKSEDDWTNFLIKILSDYETLIIVLSKISKGNNQFIYIHWYSRMHEITVGRSKIFISMLKTVKKNINKIQKKDIDFSIINNLQYNGNGDLRYDLLILLKLIKAKKENKIVKTNSIDNPYTNYEYISWFADNPKKIIDEYDHKPSYYLANKLYIPIHSQFRKKFFMTRPKSFPITSEHIYKIKKFNKKTNEEILEEIISDKSKTFYCEYYIDYLIKNGTTIDDILNKIKWTSKNKNNFEIILYELSQIDKNKIFKFLKNTNFKFLSSGLALKYQNLFTKKDVLILINLFNEQAFSSEKEYFYETLINTFEWQLFQVIIKLFMEDNKYKINDVMEVIKKLKFKNIAFQGVVDAYRYMLSDFKVVNNNPNYLFSMVQTIYFEFPCSTKLLDNNYIKIFRIYLEYFLNNKKLSIEKISFKRHLIFMIKKLPWNKISELINLIEKNKKLFKDISIIIFEKSFDLENLLCFNELKKTKYYLKNLKIFSLWVTKLWGFKDKNEFKDNYRVDLVVNFMKNNNYKIKARDFHRTISFCKDYNFSSSKLWKVITKLEEPNSNDWNRSIEPFDQENMFPYIKEKLGKDKIEKFITLLQRKGIIIPKELLIY